MVILNFIALWIIAKSYYDISNINNFIVQASQYKPWFYKGYWLVLVTISWMLVIPILRILARSALVRWINLSMLSIPFLLRAL